jgi:glycosyltransferase involved in cell wall biosynthesis
MKKKIHNPRPASISETPLVSVIMPTWNHGLYIAKSIEAVLRQTLKNIELIVVDDGSTDNTREVITEFSRRDPRVRCLYNEQNAGVPVTFNKGSRAARGAYIARADSDDPWIDDRKLEKQVAFLDLHPEYVAAGGGMVVVDRSGKELYRYLKAEHDKDIRRTALVTNPIASSTGVYRRTIALAVGLFDETLNYNEDWDFSLKMGLRGKIYNFPEYFSYYTMTGKNRSSVGMVPHTLKGFVVLWRYRGKYPGFWKSFFLHAAQLFYGLIPLSIRSRVHPALSRIKKVLSL